MINSLREIKFFEQSADNLILHLDAVCISHYECV